MDFAPTILSLAGASHLLGDKGLDGTPLGLVSGGWTRVGMGVVTG